MGNTIVTLGLTNVRPLVPFWDSNSWQLVFNISAIFYGIALVKNTAPEYLQPQSTSAVGLIFTPLLSDYEAPRKSRDLDRACLLGFAESPHKHSGLP
jgi:hypothetical protein